MEVKEIIVACMSWTEEEREVVAAKVLESVKEIVNDEVDLLTGAFRIQNQVDGRTLVASYCVSGGRATIAEHKSYEDADRFIKSFTSDIAGGYATGVSVSRERVGDKVVTYSDPELN